MISKQREDIEEKVLAILKKNNWNLVLPDNLLWDKFIDDVLDLLLDADVRERKLSLLVYTAYSSILVEACTGQDEYRLNQGYKELNMWVYKRIAARLTDSKDIDDLTQEVMQIILKSLMQKKLSAPRVLFPYVSSIIKNKLQEYYKYYRWHSNENDLSAAKEIPDSSNEVEINRLFQQTRAEVILRLQACFPARAQMQLQVLIMSMDGLSAKEIANALDINIGSVYTALNRARANFIKHCAESFKDELRRYVNKADNNSPLDTQR